MKNLSPTQAFAAALLGLAGFSVQAAQPVSSQSGSTPLANKTTRAR